MKFESIKKFIASISVVSLLAGLFAIDLIPVQIPTAIAATGAPNIISYQGRLTDSSGDLLGGSGTNYYFKFSIWNNSTVGSGSKLWPSGSPGTATSTVTDGVFNVNIGDTANGFPDALNYNFNDNDTVYLQVEVSSNGSSFETLSPRQQITSSGFAINANTLGGFSPSQSASGSQIPVLSSGNLLLGGTNPQLNATSTNTLTLQGGGGTGDIQFFSSSNKITSAGNMTIQGSFTVGSFSADPGGLANGSIFYNSTSHKFKIVENGTTKILCNTTDAGCGAGGGSVAWSNLIDPTGNLALSMGSYTTNFTWGTSTGSSNLFNLSDTASNTGTGSLISLTTASGSAASPLRVTASGVAAMYVASSGNVGFGTTTPASKVTVVGASGSSNAFTVASSTGASLVTIGPNGSTTIISLASGLVKSTSGGSLYNGMADISSETNLSVTAAGLTLNGDEVQLTSGYNIPLTASTTNWNNFYDSPSYRITAGSNLSWNGNTLNANFSTTTINGVSSTGYTFATGSATGIGLNISTSTNTVTFTPTVSSGYSIPLTASTSQWSNFYNSPISFFNAGSNIAFSGTSTIAVSSSPAFSGTLSVTGTSSLATTTITRLSVSGSSTISSLGSGLVRSTSGGDLYTDSTSYLSSAITSLNGQTGSSQTFSTSTSGGLDLYITSATNNHSFALQPSSGYSVPLSASTTQWSGLYNNILSRLAIATSISGNIFNISTSTNSLTLNLPLASITNTGQLSSADWLTFNNKLSGSLTTGYLPKATGVSSTANSLIYDTATNIGINTTTPLATLNVVGSGSNNPLVISSSTGSTLFSINTFGSTTIANLSSGLVRSTASGNLFNGLADISSDTNLAVSATGLTLNGDDIQLAAGYNIPLTASTTNWNNFYNTPSTRITAGNNLSWSGNQIDVDDVFPTYTYASSTFPSFTYASSVFATIANYPSYSYGSSTYVNYAYGSSTYATIANYPTYAYGSSTYVNFTYASSVFPSFSYASSAYATTWNLRAGSNITITTSTPGQITIASTGGSGNTTFTIGNGLIYNATSTDLVGIGTITPTTTLFVQGKGGTNPFVIASSTGVQLLTVAQNGSTTISSLGSGLVRSSNGSLFNGAADISSDTNLAVSATGLTLNGDDVQLAAGYNIPLTASTTNWNNIYDNVLSRLAIATGTAGNIFNISSSTNSVTINLPIASASNTGQLSSTDWSTFNSKESALTFVNPLQRSVNSISILLGSGSQDGYIASTSWLTFNNKLSGNLSANQVVYGTAASSTAGSNNFVWLNTPQSLGINTTTPYGSLVVQASSSDQTLPVLIVASTTGQSYFSVAPNGSTTISSLGSGLVRSTSGGSLYTDNSTYLTSALTSISALTGPAVHVATTSDTNITISINTTTANTLTFVPGFTGTLAAARLNSNVVQGVTNDTNVTGSISAQNLTLGWTGQLAVSRGGTGTSTLGNLTVNSSNLSITGGQQVLIGTSTEITLTSTPSFTTLTTTGNASIGGSLSVTGTTTLSAATTTINGVTYYWPNTQAVGTKILQNDGSGNLTWVADQTGGGGSVSGGLRGYVTTWASSTGITFGTLIDNGTVAGQNATSSTISFNLQSSPGTIDPFNVASSNQTSILRVTALGRVGIGTTTPEAKLVVVGDAGANNPLIISSSTGTSLLTVAANGSTTLSSLGTGIVRSSNGSLFNGSIDISSDTNLAVSATGLTLSGDDIQLAAGYNIPLSASTTEWSNFYNTPSTRITAGNNLSWSGNTLDVDDVFPTYTYASSTFPSFTYASSVFATIANYPTYTYGSSTYVNFTYATNTFATLLNTPSYTYGSSTYVNYAYGSSTYATIASYPTYTYASSAYATTWNLKAGSNITITTSTPGSITIASTDTGLTTIGSGNTGYVARWNGANTLAQGLLIDNGTVAGINATSSTVTFNLQGTAGGNDIFNIASSSGTSILKVLANSRIGVNSSTPTALMVVQGSNLNGNTTTPIFVVSTSTGTSLFTVAANGSTTISSLGQGLVRSTSGGSLYVDNSTYLTSAITSLNGQTGATQTFSTSTTATGLTLNITSNTNDHNWALALQSGYNIPLTASTTEWSNFYATPSTRITAGNNLSWSGNTIDVDDVFPTYAYASSSFPSFTYASSVFATIANYPTYAYASSSFPSFSYGSSTYATQASLVSYPTFTYASTTYVNFSYASNTFATLLNTPSYAYGSTTYVNFAYGSSTYATIANYPTYAYASSVFATISNYPTYAYTSSTFVNFSYASSVFPTYTYASSAYATTWNLRPGSNVTITTSTPGQITIAATDQYQGTVTSVDMTVPTGLTVSGNPITTSGTLALALDTGYVIPLQSTLDTYSTYAYGSSTYVSFPYASSTFPSFSYASSTYAILNANNIFTGANTFQGTTTLSAATTTINGVTYYWPNTQAVGTKILQNDGSGNLTWVSDQTGGSGTLSGGTKGYVMVWSSSTGATIGTLIDNGTVAGQNSTSSSVSFNLQSSPGVIDPFNVASSNQTSILRVTALGRVGIGTTTPQNLLTVQGTSGSTDNLLVVASSTGSSLFTVSPNGSTTLSSLGTGIVRSSNGSLYNGSIDISSDTNLSVSATGLTLNGDDIQLAAGYNIPLSASTTEWSNFYTTPSTRITAGNNLTWSGNQIDVDDVFPTYTYASSTFPSFTYASSVFATIANYPTYTYASSTFVNFTYASSVFPSFTYASSAYATTWNLRAGSNVTITTSTPGQITIAATDTGLTTIGSGNTGFSAIWNGANTLSQGLIRDNGTVAGINATSSTITFNLQGNAGSSDIFNVSSSTGISALRVTQSQRVGIGTTTPLATLHVQGTSTYGSINPFVVSSSTGTALLTIAPNGSTTISSLGSGLVRSTSGGSLYSDNSTYLTSALTSISALTGPAVHVATTSDTNITISINTTTANTLTFVPGFTGTLAAARLNSNVVQGVTNDTNVTGSISAQNLTLGWTGQLALSRGGLGFDGSTIAKGGIFSGTGSGTVGIQAVGSDGLCLTASSTATSGLAWSSCASGSLTGSGTNGYLSRWTSASTLSNGTILDNGTVAGINATSSTISFNLQGSGTLDPFNVSSSSGISILNVKSNLRVGIASSTPNAMFVVQGTNSAANTTTPIFVVASSTGSQLLTVLANGNVGVGTNAPQTTLHVKNSETGSSAAQLTLEGASGIGEPFAGIRFKMAPQTTGYGAAIQAEDTAAWKNSLLFKVTDGSSGASTPTEAMRIDYTGRVGIGGAGVDANSRFTVGGGNLPSLSFNGMSVTNTNNSASGSFYQTVWGSGSAVNIFGMTAANAVTLETNSSQWGAIGNRQNAPLYFGTNDLVRMSILANGLVGIGTTSPIATLSVMGTSTLPTTNIFTVASSSGAQYLTVAPNGSTTISSLGSGLVRSTGGGSLYVDNTSYLSSAITSLNGQTGSVQTFSTTTTATGLTLNITSNTNDHNWALALQSGYNIPLTASTTEWSNFYATPSTRITAGTGLSWSGNILNALNAFSGSGTNGYVTRWASSTGLTTGILLDNGTVAGVNATSSTISFNLQGSGTLDPFNVSSSSGTSILNVKSNLRVGIASTTPTAMFVVQGTNSAANTTTPIFVVASSTGQQLMTVLANGNVGIGTANPSYLFDISGSNAATSGTNNFNNFIYTVNPTATTTATNTGIKLQVTSPATTANIGYGTMQGLDIDVWLDPSLGTTPSANSLMGGDITVSNLGGTVSSVTGLSLTAMNSGSPTSTVSSLTGLDILMESDGPAFVTNSYGVYLNQTLNGVSTMTNRYGIYLQADNGGTITNDYAIYQEASNQRNYFAGNFGIGSTTPIGKLAVVGTAGSTNNILTVASSNNSSLLSIAPNGSTTISSLGSGLVRSTSGGSLYTDNSTYLTSALTSISALTGPAVHVATTSDTNITISINTTTANTLTFVPGWTGTLAVSRGGTGTSTIGSAGSIAYSDGSTFRFNQAGTAGNFLMSNGTGQPAWTSTSTLFGGTPIVSTGTNGYVTRWTGASTLGTGILLDNGTVAGINATSSSYTFNLQGAAGVNPLQISSSTGATLFTISNKGNLYSESRVGVSASTFSGAQFANYDDHTSGTTTNVYALLLNAYGDLSATTVNQSALSITLSHDGVGLTQNQMGIYVQASGVSAGLVTNKYGIRVENQGGATNNYALYLNQSSAATNYSLFSPGTAKSYFAGVIGVGSTTPSATLVVQGTSTSPTLPLVTIASSSGTSFLTVAASGLTTINQLTVTGTTTLSVATTTINGVTYYWPNALPAGNRILQSDSSGNLSWVADQTGGGGSVSGGLTGYVTTWASSTGLTYGKLIDNGTVAGINATSSTVSFNIQGSGTLDPFNISSSSGSSYLRVTQAGNVGVGTSTPLAKVHIYDTVGTENILFRSGPTSGFASGGFSSVAPNVFSVVNQPFDEPALLVYSESQSGGLGAYALKAESLLAAGGQTGANLDGIVISATNVRATTGLDTLTALRATLGHENGSANFIDGFNFRINSQSEVGSLTGGRITINNISTTSNQQVGLHVRTETDVGGVVPANYGILVNGFNDGDVTDSYGLYIDSFSFGSNQNYQIFSNTTNPFVVTGTSRVGVGTSTPNATLHVQGIAGSTNIFVISSSTGTSLFTIAPNGSTTISSLGSGLVRSTSGGSLYTDNSTYLTSALTSISALTGPAVHVATTSDTNITISINTTTANTLTFVPGWTGTLAVSRGGTGTSTIGSAGSIAYSDGSTFRFNQAGTAGNFLMSNGSGQPTWTSTSTLFGGTPIVSTGTNGYVTRWTGASALGTGVLLDNGSVTGVNATSSTVSFNLQGSGTLDPFNVSSSSGTSILNVKSNLRVGIASSTPNAMFVVQGTNSAANTTTPIFVVASSTGSQLLSVLANGNVGVGTSNPGFNMHLVANNPVFRIQNGSAISDFSDLLIELSSAGTSLVVNGGNFDIQTNTAAGATVGGTQRFLITNAGNVGIGTSSPTARLTVTSSGTTSPFIISSSSGTTLLSVDNQGNFNLATLTTSSLVMSDANKNLQSVTLGSGLSISGSTLNTTQAGGIWTLGSGLIYNATSTDLVGIGTITPTTTLFVQGKAGTNPFAIASSTGTQLVSVDQRGFMAIGTTTPSAKLHVLGDANTSGESWNNLQVWITGSTNVSRRLGLGYDTTNNHGEIQSGESGSGWTPLSLNPFGSYVGIGTTTPAGPLEVVDLTQNGPVGLRVSNRGTARIQINNTSPSGGGLWQIVNGVQSNQDLAFMAGALGGVGNFGTTVLYMNTSGRVGVNTSTPLAALFVQGTSTTANALVVASSTGTSMLTIGPNGSTTLSSLASAGCVAATASGQLYITSCGAGSLTGSGTAGYNAIWTSVSALGNGIIIDNGTVAGVNATSSTVTFNLQGTAGTNDILNIASSTGNSIVIVKANQRVGINTSTPSATLSIQNATSSINALQITNSAGTSQLMIVSDTGAVTVGGGNGSITASAMFSPIFGPSTYGGTFSLGLNMGGPTMNVYTPIWVLQNNFNYRLGIYNHAFTGSGSVLTGTTSPIATLGLVSNSSTLPTLLVQGTSTQTTSLFIVASSTGAQYLTVASNGSTTLSSLASAGCVGTTASGDLYVTSCGGGSLTGSGTNGQVAYYTGASTLTSAAALLNNGTVVGINATSATISLNVQGTGTLDPFDVSSSTGISVLRVTNAQRVGIGTTTPLATLHVQGTSTYSSVNPFIVSSSTGSTLFAVRPNGYVGIGTASPAKETHFLYTSSNPTLRLETTSNVNGNYVGLELKVNENDSFIGLLAMAPSNSNSVYGGANSLNLINRYTANLTFGTADTVRMLIDGSGFVGIGSTTPTAKLTVVGTSGSASNVFTVASSNNSSLLSVAPNGSTTLSSLASAGCVAATASGQLYITSCGAGSLTGSGTVGYNAIWTSSSALGNGIIIDNGTVAGINATSSSYTFNLQGSAGVNPLNVASSTGTSLFNVAHNGNVAIGFAASAVNLSVNGAVTIGDSEAYEGKLSIIQDSSVATALTNTAGIDIASGAGSVINLKIGTDNDNSLAYLQTVLGGEANSTQALLLQPHAGKVGIGSTSPNATLVVQGTTTSPTLQVFAVASSSGSQYLSVLANGNVGIGTSTYSSKLTIQDSGTSVGSSDPAMTIYVHNSNGSPALALKKPSGAAGAQEYRLGLVGNGNNQFVVYDATNNRYPFAATPNSLIGINSTTPTAMLTVQGNTVSANQTLDLFRIATSSGSIYLNVTSQGNVGIGTTTPGNTLTVVGAIDTSSSYKINNTIRLLSSANYTELQDGSSNTRIHLGNSNDPSNYYSNGSHIFRNSGGSLEYARITSAGLFGIGTSSPIATLAVMGTSTLPTTNIFTVASSSGAQYLNVASNGSTTLSSLASAGCVASTASGQLYITSCGTGSLSGSGSVGYNAIWTSSSALGNGIIIDNGTVVGINATSSSYTFNLQGSAGVNPLNIASSTGTSMVVVDRLGRVGIGTNTPIATLNLVGSTTGNGANAIAGILASTTLSNGTAGAFQFGHRFISTITGAASGTLDGMLIRTIDNTSNANTVRALEVQAYSGSNTSGINTGIQVYGKTFGVYAYTDGLAGSVSQPAALFGELGHPTSGNALRLYSATATGATLMSIYHETSNATGTALSMDLGNGSGSFNGNFIALRKAGTNKVLIDSFGQASFGTTSIGSMFDIASSTSASDINLFRVVSNVGATGNVKFRIDSDGDVYSDGTNNLGSGADLAENYTALDLSLEAGDIVALSTTTVNSISSESQDNQVIEQLAGIVKASSSTQNALGIIASKPGILMSSNQLNSKPVALAGRVPVKVSLENGPIDIGDYLVLSKMVPGAAAKGLYSGNVIGKALEPYHSTSTPEKVLAFIEFGWRNINNKFVLENNGGQLTGQVGTSTQAANSFIIDQTGIGDILQLQQAGQNRVVFGQQGDMSILASTTVATTTLLSVTNGTTSVFSINARGDVQTKGIIIVKDDSFAGSIATNELGEANITFSYDLGTGKPDVQLTVEGEIPALAQVISWTKDEQQRYTGFKIKTFGLSGSPASVIVHYLVVGKEDGYVTNGQPVLTVQSDPSSGGGAGGNETPNDPPTEEGVGSGSTEGGSEESSGEVAGESTNSDLEGQDQTTDSESNSTQQTSTETPPVVEPPTEVAPDPVTEPLTINEEN